jgi:hypothetical protein
LTLKRSRQKKRVDARSEWIGIFESPSASSLESGFAKTPPTGLPVAPRFQQTGH